MVVAAGRIAALSFLIVCTCVPSRAAADVITQAGSLDVTSGQLVIDPISGAAPFSFGGPGFTASALLVTSSFYPQRCLDFGPCVPGNYQFVEHAWLGTEIPEWQMTLEGTEYAGGGTVYTGVGNEGVPSMQLGINAAVLLPEFGDASIVVTTPFKLGGVFVYESGDRVFDRRIQGRGTASVWLSRALNANGTAVWQVGRVQYDIDPAGPTPEPATLLLFGSGLTGIAVRRLRRRH